jgi:hypothetical protein
MRLPSGRCTQSTTRSFPSFSSNLIGVIDVLQVPLKNTATYNQIIDVHCNIWDKMKSKKAFIKLNGEVGEKELPCVEYVDNNFLNRIENQKQEINKILLGNNIKKKKAVKTKKKTN